MRVAVYLLRTAVATSAPRAISLLVASVCAVCLSFAQEPEGSFDAPIRIASIELGPSPFFEDPDKRNILNCYYYPDLMIKEFSELGSGADRLSMVPLRGDLPECALPALRRERVIEGSQWHGWFKGVKDTLAFFDAPDAFNGHLPFAVFDSETGEKIFEDTAYGEQVSSSDYRASRVQVFSTGEGYSLKYMRVTDAGCDLHLEGSLCWQQIREELDLQSSDVPVCTGYDQIARVIGTDHAESVIAYPVEVSLYPQPATKTLAGTAKCWAAQ